MGNVKKKSSTLRTEFGLTKNYLSSKPLSTDDAVITVNKLSYGYLENSYLRGISVGGDSMTFELRENPIDTWIDCILLMLSTLHASFKHDFKNEMLKRKILNSDFSIEVYYGKVDGSKNYRTFKIPESDFYLELNAVTEVVYTAFIRLVAATFGSVQDVTICIESVKSDGRSVGEFEGHGVEVDIDMSESLRHERPDKPVESVIIGLYEYINNYDMYGHIQDIIVYGEPLGVHRADAALYVFAKANASRLVGAEIEKLNTKEVGFKDGKLYCNSTGKEVLVYLRSLYRAFNEPADSIMFQVERKE